MAMSRRLLVPAVVLVALLALGRATPAAVAQPGAPPALQWAPCDDMPGEFECTTIQVPIDHARPNGPQFGLRLGRLPNTDPGSRRGSLLIIPGGPGAGIKTMLIDQPPSPPNLAQWRKYYDVVSFDPRGIERSSPLRCAPDLLPPVIAPPDRPPTREEFDAIVRANAAFFRSCFELTGELMNYLSTKDTSADIERIRLALGQDDGLVAYGGSQGSVYGAEYLELHGDRVKTLVIDAVVDHTVANLATYIMRNVISVQQSYDRFVRWCAREPECALRGTDVNAAYDAAVAAQPTVRKLVSQFLAGGAESWPLIAELLVEVAAGDTSTLDELTSAGSLAVASEDPTVVAGKNAIIQGVYCADYGPQNDYAALLEASATVARLAPRFAWKYWVATPLALASAGATMCAGWPNEATNPPHRLRVGAHPNVMVASATYDPPTPLTNALNVWLQIPEAKLLIAETDGHQALLASDCAFEVVLDFFLDPASVQPTTICPN